MVGNRQNEDRRADCGGRRDSDECLYHEAHEVRFGANEKDISGNRICVNAIKEEMKTKVPFRVFYLVSVSFFSLVISIFGVQWASYEKINDIALDHATQMGMITTSLAEVKKDIQHANQISKTARETMKDAFESANAKTELQIEGIKNQIDKLDKK